LSHLLKKYTDVIKLDIEGAEGEALKEAYKALMNVSEILIEYHANSKRGYNDISNILRMLKNTGFSFSINNTISVFNEKKGL